MTVELGGGWANQEMPSIGRWCHWAAYIRSQQGKLYGLASSECWLLSNGRIACPAW